MSEWQPIDSAPNGIYVLACNRENFNGGPYSGPYWVRRILPEYGCDFADRDGLLYRSLTHWMPISPPPAPPQTEDMT